MKELIDTIFDPVLMWLVQSRQYLDSISVPLARPIRLGDYFGYFEMLGPYWMMFIQQSISLAVILGFTFLMVASNGLLLRFKESVKWW